MKVSIKNYQAIKNVELEFPPGITAIVGNSNNGKSSIIRAIEAAINNKGGSSFINYDADECEVAITHDGADIKWIKSKKPGKSHYIINGTKINKIGQTQVPEVAQLLNMGEVEVNNERFRLNFWKQLDYPFLVGKTPYQLFDFISKSDEQDKVKQFQDDTVVDRKSVTNEVTTNTTKIDMITSDIVKLGEEQDQLQVFVDFDLEAYEELLEQYNDLDHVIETYENSEKFLKAGKEVLKDAEDQLTKLNDYMTKLELGITLFDALSTCVSSISDVESELNRYSKIAKDCETHEKLNQDKITKLEEIIETVAKLTLELEEYDNLIEACEGTIVSINGYKKSLQTIENELKDIEAELDTFDVCPFCDSNLGNHDHA